MIWTQVSFSLKQLLTQNSILLKQVNKESSPENTKMTSNNENNNKNKELLITSSKKNKELVCQAPDIQIIDKN